MKKRRWGGGWKRERAAERGTCRGDLYVAWSIFFIFLGILNAEKGNKEIEGEKKEKYLWKKYLYDCCRDWSPFFLPPQPTNQPAATMDVHRLQVARKTHRRPEGEEERIEREGNARQGPPRELK